MQAFEINLAGIEFIGNYFSRAYGPFAGVEDEDEGERRWWRGEECVMGAANAPRQARIRVERRLPLGVETKARSCRGCGRTFSTGSYTRRTVETEIEREGEGRGRATGGRITGWRTRRRRRRRRRRWRRDGERGGRARGWRYITRQLPDATVRANCAWGT